jgi:hypothetical protein
MTTEINEHKLAWVERILNVAQRENINREVVTLLGIVTSGGYDAKHNVPQLASELETIIRELRERYLALIADSVDLIPARWETFDKNFL